MAKTKSNNPARESLTLCNSQAGFDIRINQLYILHLSKSEHGYEPRSGPFSIGWLKEGNKLCFGKRGWEWQTEIVADEYINKLSK